MTPIVGVMGSGSQSHDLLCAQVAREIAELRAWLLVGGGGGVMASVAKHYKALKPDGWVIGVLPCRASGETEAPPGYPNPWVDIAIQTHLHLSGARGTEPLSRNHINVLSSWAVVALPGGAGTVSEVLLAHAYRRPVIVYHGPYPPLAGVPKEVPQTDRVAAVADFLRQSIHSAPHIR